MQQKTKIIISSDDVKYVEDILYKFYLDKIISYLQVYLEKN